MTPGFTEGWHASPAVAGIEAAGSLSGMGAVGAQDVQRAYDAAVSGDMEALAAMLSPDVDWRGLERGRWLWRKAPA